MSRTEVRYKPSMKLYEEPEVIPGNPAYKWLLPLAVPFDIATGPIQFLLICIIGFPTAPKAPKKADAATPTPAPSQIASEARRRPAGKSATPAPGKMQ